MSVMCEVEQASEELPRATPEAVLMRVLIGSLVTVLSERKGRELLTDMAKTLATEHSVANVLPIRPKSQDAEVSRARRGAVALFRKQLPVYLARLPRR